MGLNEKTIDRYVSMPIGILRRLRRRWSSRGPGACCWFQCPSAFSVDCDVGAAMSIAVAHDEFQYPSAFSVDCDVRVRDISAERIRQVSMPIGILRRLRRMRKRGGQKPRTGFNAH